MKKEYRKCKYCGGNCVVKRCGDNKSFFVGVCDSCGRTPVPFNEASSTYDSAIENWNKHQNEQDMVEVVRCKDCLRYKMMPTFNCKEFPACVEIIKDKYHVVRWVSPDCFCDEGVRK